MFTVCIQGLEFYGFHGVTVEERTLGHRFIADVRLEVDGTADQTDDLEGTVDYAGVANLLTEICSRKEFMTLERMGSVITEELLNRHELIRSVWVRVAKRLPPANMMAESVGVEIERSR